MRRYRRALQVGLFLVILAFVLTSVFVFGQGSRQEGDPRAGVATINGEAIPYERYQRAYQSYLNVYSQAARRQLSPEQAEQLGLGAQVVEALVNEVIVVQRARAEGLEATDRDVNDYVYAIPAFQENGRFSLTRYQEALRRASLTDVAFERDVRRELTRARVEAAVRSGVKVSEAEVEQAFTTRREEVRAAWALVDLAPLTAAATVSDDELTTYLKEHGDEFRQPERRKIVYVALSPGSFTRPPSEAEIEKYYTEHAAEFDVPREVRTAHILVRVGETGGSEAEDRARNKVADAIRRAKAGEDFAKLAREISEDVASKPNGGELGWVKKGEMVPPFDQALTTLRKGEVTTEPVRTAFGYHAIRAIDVREGGRRSLKEVAPSLRDRLAGEAAERAARARADEVRPPLQAASDFASEAKRLHLNPIETTVARTERGPGLGGTEPLEEAAFALAVGGVSPPVKTPAGWVILRAQESIPAGVPPLAEIKDAVTTAAKRRKADATALERAKQLSTDARSGDFTAVARKVGAVVGETPRYSRAKPAERLPGDAMLAALGTPIGMVTEPVKTPQGYYVLKVVERVPPSLDDLPRERDALTRELLAAKQTQAWETWIGQARASAKIEVGSRVQPVRRGRS
jgi:peptidyl-prolyl cis-trans isomerase D